MPAAERLHAVVAEDCVLLRAGIVRLLEEADVDVVGQAGDGEELVRKVRAHRPDVAIIDIRMPPRQLDEGLCAARVIRTELPWVGVLLLSQHVEQSYATELLEQGAEGVGYLLKERVAEVGSFLDAVRRVAHGGAVLDPEVISHMMGRRRRHPEALDRLSERDRDVLAQMAQGASNQAIAHRMFLSERAIERHVSAIFAALGLPRCRTTHRRVLAVLAHLRAA
jgi:DNA-binding NarL/FixJ family response regulator